MFLRELAATAHHQDLPQPAAHDVRDLQLLRLVSDTGPYLRVRVYDDSQEHVLRHIYTSAIILFNDILSLPYDSQITFVHFSH